MTLRSPRTRTKDKARIDPTLFSAAHTYVPASAAVALVIRTELRPDWSTEAPVTV